MKTDNSTLSDLIKDIINSPGDFIPEDSRETLMNLLSKSTLICPVDETGKLMLINIGPNTFIPASCDMDDFKKIFKDNPSKAFEFGELSQYLKAGIGGIMLNPATAGFVLNSDLAWMIFNRISDENRPPVMKGYDVKVRLNDFRPLTWRDLIIPENITFYELDDILKTLWGFNGHHLSMFLVKNQHIRIMDETVADACMADNFLNSKTTTVNEFFDKFKKITYWYDFGDDWQFDIEIKKTVDYDKNHVTIKRFKGKYNPIEDCKGVYGLSEIVWYYENPEMQDDSYFSDLTEYLYEFDMDYAQELLREKNYVRRQYE